MQKDKIHYILQTNSLQLKPYSKKFVQQYHSWFDNDQELLRLTGSEPLTYEEELENHQSWLTDPKKYTFLVFKKDNNKLIGDVNLFFSDWIQPNEAQINIMIAVKQYRGKGLARQIMEAIEDFTVGVYEKDEIIAKIKDDNTASIKFFEKIGYKFINHSTHHGEVQYRKKLPLCNRVAILQKLKGELGMREETNVAELFSL